jgi:hypothetical protein
MLPFPRNEHFVGREDQFFVLERLLPSNTHQRMAIYGSGGCGKSALALEFAYRRLARHAGRSLVFWVPAINRESFELAYREIGIRLRIPGITDDNANVRELVKSALSSETLGDWLMVVDNVDDRMSVGWSSYLPHSNRGTILFITRSMSIVTDLTPSSVIHLHNMRQAEARQLLARHITKQALLKGKVAVDELLGQNNAGISQAETLSEWDERTTMSEKKTIYIARVLADHGEMRRLCSKVLDKIDQVQFVDVGRQLLKSFYRGLEKSAKTELERQSAGLLKSRSDRKKICENIADIIKFEDTQNKEEKARAAEQLRLAGQRLVEVITKDSPDTYPFRGLESEPESEYNNLLNLAKMTEFFRVSKPFRVLLNDLRTQLLPHSLKDIVQTAPYGSMWLIDQNNNSITNRMKAFVEDFTMLEWNWWPLEPRMKNMDLDKMRLFWHCVSRKSTKLLKLIIYSLVVHGSGKRSPGKTPT